MAGDRKSRNRFSIPEVPDPLRRSSTKDEARADEKPRTEGSISSENKDQLVSIGEEEEEKSIIEIIEEPPPVVKETAKIIKESFGVYKKRPPEKAKTEEPQELAEGMVYRYTLCNTNDVMVQIINFGATITSIKVPDKNGSVTDILLGFDTYEEYASLKKNPMSLGATFGRYSNMVSEAVLKINHNEYLLSTNLGKHHYRGGFSGFDQKLWDSSVVRDKVVMTCMSADMEEGYPGLLMVQLKFQLTMDNTLVVRTSVTASKPSIVGLGHNLYFNLAGHAAGAEGLRDHAILVNADKVVIEDRKTKIPTGELLNVGATYFDLRVPRPLGKAIAKAPGGGYDLTFCLTKGYPKHSVTFACRLAHPETGRFLEVMTDMPGLHVETGTRLPDPSQIRPPEDGDVGIPDDLIPLFCRQSQEEDEYYKKLQERLESRQLWPRPASLPSEEHFFPRFGELEDEGEEGESKFSESLPSRLGPPESVSEEEDTEELRKTYLQDEAEDSSSEDEGGAWTPPKPIEGKQGALYKIFGAVCLMPEEYPDPMKHKYFPEPIIYPGKTLTRTVKYRFGIIPPRKELDLTIYM